MWFGIECDYKIIFWCGGCWNWGWGLCFGLDWWRYVLIIFGGYLGNYLGDWVVWGMKVVCFGIGKCWEGVCYVIV